MENDLSRKLITFENDPNQKDICLQNELSISELTLKEIKRKRTKRYTLFADKLVDIGTFVKDAMLETDSKRKYPLSSYFTGMSLAALAFDDWDNPKSLSTKVSEAIVKRYKEDKKGLEAFLGMNVPSMHLFRQEIGLYTGNLEDAKMIWKNIDISADDWMYNIQLPMKFDEKLAFILGVIWADGCYNSGTKEIQLSCCEEDTLFYTTVVNPLLEYLFNKSFKIDDNRKDKSRKDKREPRDTTRIHMQSTAICSFLMNEFGFPRKKEKYSIPNFETIDCYNELSSKDKLTVKKQFFAGIISAMGTYQYNISRNSHSLTLYDIDRVFIQSLNDLAKELELFPHYFGRIQKNNKTYGTIIFNGPNCKELYQQNYVRNPSLYAFDSLVKLL